MSVTWKFDSAKCSTRALHVDKRTKKKIDVLNKKLATLRQQLKGAKAQLDEPAEVARLEEAVRAAEEQLASLRGR